VCALVRFSIGAPEGGKSRRVSPRRPRRVPPSAPAQGGPARARSGIAKHLKGAPTVYLRKWVRLLRGRLLRRAGLSDNLADAGG
jgi:hypothetical protein